VDPYDGQEESRVGWGCVVELCGYGCIMVLAGIVVVLSCSSLVIINVVVVGKVIVASSSVSLVAIISVGGVVVGGVEFHCGAGFLLVGGHCIACWGIAAV